MCPIGDGPSTKSHNVALPTPKDCEKRVDGTSSNILRHAAWQKTR